MQLLGEGLKVSMQAFPKNFMNRSIHSGMLFFPDSSFSQILIQPSVDPVPQVDSNSSFEEDPPRRFLTGSRLLVLKDNYSETDYLF